MKKTLFILIIMIVFCTHCAPSQQNQEKSIKQIIHQSVSALCLNDPQQGIEHFADEVRFKKDGEPLTKDILKQKTEQYHTLFFKKNSSCRLVEIKYNYIEILNTKASVGFEYTIRAHKRDSNNIEDQLIKRIAHLEKSYGKWKITQWLHVTEEEIVKEMQESKKELIL